jgi:hypothetical protein
MIRSTCFALVFWGLAVSTGCGTDASKSGSNAGGAGGAAVPGAAGASANSAGSAAVAGSAGSSNSGGSATGGSADGGGNSATAGSASSSAGSSGALGAAGSTGSVGGNAGSAGAANAPFFSDDFEGPALDIVKWKTRINSNGKFDLDSTQKHGGSKSLHLKHTGFSSMLTYQDTPFFPAPNNTFYARLWLRVAGPLPQGHVVWIEAGDTENDTHEVRVGMNIGKFQSNLYKNGEVDIRDPDAKIMAATWQCVQLKYGPDLLDVSLDGVHSSVSTTTWVAADPANGSTTTAKTNWAPAYASFRIGWELGDGEIWFDDVALSHSPIPCN